MKKYMIEEVELDENNCIKNGWFTKEFDTLEDAKKYGYELANDWRTKANDIGEIWIHEFECSAYGEMVEDSWQELLMMTVQGKDGK